MRKNQLQAFIFFSQSLITGYLLSSPTILFNLNIIFVYIAVGVHNNGDHDHQKVLNLI